MTGLREDKEPENCPFTKDLNSPKVQLSEFSCTSFHRYFSINFLLYHLNSLLTRQRLETIATTSGSWGPVVRTPGLGN